MANAQTVLATKEELAQNEPPDWFFPQAPRPATPQLPPSRQQQQLPSQIQSFEQFNELLDNASDPMAMFAQAMDDQWRVKSPEQKARVYEQYARDNAYRDSSAYNRDTIGKLLDRRKADMEKVFPDLKFNEARYHSLMRAYRTARNVVDKWNQEQQIDAADEDILAIPKPDRELFAMALADVAERRLEKDEGFWGKFGQRVSRGYQGIATNVERTVAKALPGEGGDRTLEGLEWLHDMQNMILDQGNPAKGSNWASEAFLSAAEMAPPMMVSSLVPGGGLGAAAKQTAFWATQIAPDLEKDLVQRGMDRTKASALAWPTAILEGVLENLEPRQAMAMAGKEGRGTLVKMIKDAAGGYLKEYSEEFLQALAEVGMRGVASVWDPKVKFDLAGEMQGLSEQMQQTGLPLLAIMAPGGVAGGVKRGLDARQGRIDATATLATRGVRKQELTAEHSFLQTWRAERKGIEKGFREREAAAINEPYTPERTMPPDVANRLAEQRRGANYAPGIQAKLDELRAARAKGWVTKEEGEALGMTPAELKNRGTRLTALDGRIEQLTQEAEDASTIRSPQEEVREEQGSQDLRGTGQVEVPAQSAGEVTPAQEEVPVAKQPWETTRSEAATEGWGDNWSSVVRRGIDQGKPVPQTIQNELAAYDAERGAKRKPQKPEMPKAKAGDTVVRYTHKDGTGLLNNTGLDRSKLTDDEDAELVQLMDFGLQQPAQGTQGTFYFTQEGEKKHARMLELLSKASKSGIVRTESTLQSEPTWQSDDGQLASPVAAQPEPIKATEPAPPSKLPSTDEIEAKFKELKAAEFRGWLKENGLPTANPTKKGVRDDAVNFVKREAVTAVQTGKKPAPAAEPEPVKPAATGEAAYEKAVATSRKLTEVQSRKPRTIKQLYGKKGPTPEQAADHAAKMKEWNREYRAAQKAHKEYLESQRNRPAPPPVEAKPTQPKQAAKKPSPAERAFADTTDDQLQKLATRFGIKETERGKIIEAIAAHPRGKQFIEENFPDSDYAIQKQRTGWQADATNAVRGKVRVGDGVSLETLYAQLKESYPDLTPEEFSKGMRELAAQGQVKLDEHTRAPAEVMVTDERGNLVPDAKGNWQYKPGIIEGQKEWVSGSPQIFSTVRGVEQEGKNKITGRKPAAKRSTAQIRKDLETALVAKRGSVKVEDTQDGFIVTLPKGETIEVLITQAGIVAEESGAQAHGKTVADVQQMEERGGGVAGATVRPGGFVRLKDGTVLTFDRLTVLIDPSLADSATAAHEMKHVAEDWGFFKTKEGERIYQSLLKKYGSDEKIADARGDWTAPDGLWQKMRDYIRRILEPLKRALGLGMNPKLALAKTFEETFWTQEDYRNPEIFPGTTDAGPLTPAGGISYKIADVKRTKLEVQGRGLPATVGADLKDSFDGLKQWLYTELASLSDMVDPKVAWHTPTEGQSLIEYGRRYFSQRGIAELKRTFKGNKPPAWVEDKKLWQDIKDDLKIAEKIAKGKYEGDIRTTWAQAFLSTNIKTGGYSWDFALMTCLPTERCSVCYAKGMATVEKPVSNARLRHTIVTALHPEVIGKTIGQWITQQPKGDMPFLRINGAGDSTFSWQIDAINAAISVMDRPVHIFSRSHTARTQDGGSLSDISNGHYDPKDPSSGCVVYKMGSVDKQLRDEYGDKFLKENLEKRGIFNSYLVGAVEDVAIVQELHAKGIFVILHVNATNEIVTALDEAGLLATSDRSGSMLIVPMCACALETGPKINGCATCLVSGGPCFAWGTQVGMTPKGKLYSYKELLNGTRSAPKERLVPMAQIGMLAGEAGEQVTLDVIAKSYESAVKHLRGVIAAAMRNLTNINVYNPRSRETIVTLTPTKGHANTARKIASQWTHFAKQLREGSATEQQIQEDAATIQGNAAADRAAKKFAGRTPGASYSLKPGQSTFDALMEFLDRAEEEDRRTTGTKHAKTDELRAAIGMEPRPKVVKEYAEEWEVEAAKRRKDPKYVPDLVARLIDKPFPPDKIENAALGQEIVDLENRRRAGEDVLDQLADTILASTVGGTEAGRSLASRVGERYSDFSLAGLIGQHIDKLGEKPNEEMMAKLKEMAAKIEKQDAEIAELRKRKTEEEIDRLIEDALKNVQKPPREKAGTKRARLQKQASEAVANFKSAWNDAVKAAGGAFFPSGPGMNPEALAALGRAAKAAAGVVKAYAELGVNSFLEFTARIKQDIGDITEEQSKLFREEWDKAFKDVESPLGEEPTPAMIGAEARSLARWAIASGIRGRENVIDAVHAVLTEFGVEQTRDETMDAISGYGNFRELPHDIVSDLLRGYRSEMQKLGQLRSMEQGRAPLRTGVEQGELTEEGRKLQKDVNEAKKKGGYLVTDPKKELKSALDTAKTTVDNAIKDADAAIDALKKAIASQTQLAKPEERTPGPTDPALEAMRAKLAEKRAQRKELKAEYDKLFPPKLGPLSDARRLAMAEALMKRLNKELAVEIQSLKDGTWVPGAQKSPLTSQELTRQEALRDALTASLDEARKASPTYQAQLEAKENARYLKNLERQEAFWKKRAVEAKSGILPKRKLKKTVTDKKLLDKMMERDKAKREALAEIEAEKKRRWDLGQKLYHGLSEISTALPRELMAGLENSVVLRQGWFFTMQAPFHPIIVFSRIVDGIQSMFSERIAAASREDLRQRGNAPEYPKAGIEMTDVRGPLNGMDELYQSRIVDWLARTEGILWFPARFAAKGYIATARGFSTFSNGMKADIYDMLKQDTMNIRRFFNKHGMAKVPEWTESDTVLTGRSSNIFGGRGTGLKEGGLLNYLLWAPKWILSRLQAEFMLPLQMATPKFLGRWNADPAVRLAHAKFYAQALVGAATHLAALYWTLTLLAGDDEDKKPKIEWDTTSTDLWKLKVKDTRIDVMGGLSQYLVFASRLLHGSRKSTSGKVVPLRGEGSNKFQGDMWDEMTKQLRYKLGPTASGLVDFFAQKTAVGEELPEGKLARTGSIVARRLVPMTWPDIFEAERSLGMKQGTVAALEAFMGASVNTYGDRIKYRDGTKEERQEQFQKDLKAMQWDSPPPAYSEYLTKEQLKAVDKRIEEKKRNLLYDALVPKPSKASKDYEGAVKTWQARQEKLKQLSQSVPYEEAVRLLQLSIAYQRQERIEKQELEDAEEAGMLRNDGTLKGTGWLGPLKGRGKLAGETMTEYTIGVEFDGKEMEIPTLIPGLTDSELDSVLRGNVTPAVERKAVEHAKKQLSRGESVFKDNPPSYSGTYATDWEGPDYAGDAYDDRLEILQKLYGRQ